MSFCIRCIICFLVGVIVGCTIHCWSGLDCSLKLVDILTITSTIAVAFAVVLLTKFHANNDVARQYIINDLDELCKIYKEISAIIENLNKCDDIVARNDRAKKKIQLLLGNGDTLIDLISDEVDATYDRKDEGEQLRRASGVYHKFLTDGELWSKSDFSVTPTFIKENNENLKETITGIKKRAIEIIKKS